MTRSQTHIDPEISRAASLLARQQRGIPKRYTPAERARRARQVQAAHMAYLARKRAAASASSRASGEP